MKEPPWTFRISLLKNAAKWEFIWVCMIRDGSQMYLEIAQGQGSTGSITGTVMDTSGAVISGANVTITSAATGNTLTIATNSHGVFVVPTLRPGVYTVTFNAMGFKEAGVTQIQIDVGKFSSIDVDMEVGRVKETVTVGAGDALQTQTATSGAISTVAGTPFVTEHDLKL